MDTAAIINKYCSGYKTEEWNSHEMNNIKQKIVQNAPQ